MKEEQLMQLEVLGLKEELLGQLIVWLRAKGLYEQASKDISLLPEEKTNDPKE